MLNKEISYPQSIFQVPSIVELKNREKVDKIKNDQQFNNNLISELDELNNQLFDLKIRLPQISDSINNLYNKLDINKLQNFDNSEDLMKSEVLNNSQDIFSYKVPENNSSNPNKYCSVLYKDYKKSCLDTWETEKNVNTTNEDILNIMYKLDECIYKRQNQYNQCRAFQTPGHLGAIEKLKNIRTFYTNLLSDRITNQKLIFSAFKK